MSAEAIRASFEALLAQDWETARRCLAAAQSEHYGLKPWRLGCPTEDALGRSIVFAENGGRYTVKGAHANGAHIRVDIGDARYIGPFLTFEARAPSAMEAQLLASVYTTAEDLKNLASTSSEALPEGWVCIHYRHGRSLD